MLVSRLVWAAFTCLALEAAAAPLPLGDDATIANGDIANGVQVLDIASQISQAFNNPQSMSKTYKRSPLGDDATIGNGDIANGVQVCE